MPPAAKETAAGSTDEATRVSTSLAAKRFREDDLGMTSSSSNQVGDKKKRKNCGDGIPLSKLEQKASSRDTISDEVETVGDDTEENNENSDSGEEKSDDFESSGLAQRDIIELDRQDIKEQLSSGSSILVLETTSNLRSSCRANLCIPKLLRGRPNIECDYRFNLLDCTGQRRSDMTWYPREYRPSRSYVSGLI